MASPAHPGLARPRAAALAGLAVIGGAPEAGVRLARWGARPVAEEGAAGLRHALARADLRAVLALPPGHLPIRPVAEAAAALLDGADHVGPDPAAGWCLTAGSARRALALLEGGAVACPHEAACRAAAHPAPPPCHAAPAPLRLPDLPAAFASGRPFAGPFDPADRLATGRALAAAEGRRPPRRPPLPPGLTLRGTAPELRPGDTLALLVARNEALRLPDALAQLRALGLHQVVVIDNMSEDDTAAIALAAGAHVVTAEDDYAGSGFGIAWTNAVLDAFARGHWVLVVDADEQLVFPGSGRAGVPALAAHLDALGSEALRTFMLDCFPDGPLAEVAYRPGTPLAEAAPLFEPPRLRREPIADFPYALDYGGIRERLFFPETDPRRPVRWMRQKLFNLGLRLPGLAGHPAFARLAPPRSPTVTKVPLLRWRDGAALLGSTHRVAPMAMAPDQPTGVLLHYKFLQDFHARAVDAVARGAHFDNSREYRRYLERLEVDPRFSLAGPGAVRYAGPDQLVALGLMRDTEAWRRARRAG